MIRLPNVGVIFRKEILDSLRDKRTVYGMVVLPIVIYPLMLVLFSQVLLSQTQKLKEKKYAVGVVGGAHAPGLVERLKADGTWELTDLAGTAPEANDAQLLEGKLQIVIVVPPDFTDAIKEERSARVGLRFNNAKDESIFAQNRVEKVVEEYGNELLKQRLAGKPEGYARPVDVVATGVAPPEKAGGFHLGRLLAMLLVMMTAVSAFYPAIDMASGEKERGTMETLLVSPALRSEIVLGKYFAVAAIALVTAMLHLTSMGLTFSHFFKSMMGANPAGISFSINFSNALLVILPMLPLTLFFSALCLGLSAFARSYKESMVYLTPVMIIANITAFSALIPGIEFNYALALLPVQNCAMLTVQLLSGDWKWGHLLVTVASSAFYALVALRWTWSIFQREDVLLRGGAEFDWRQWLRTFGTARPGLGHALVAVIAMMALQIAFAANLVGLSTQRQFLVQQIFLIAAPAAALAVVGGLNFRSTFRLRVGHPVHLALAPLLAAAGLVLAFHLNHLLIKIPYFQESALEHSEQLGQRIDALKSFPAMLLFMAFLPALCEEFLFRGLVLSGLRRDLGKWIGILGCGALFGVVHQVPISVVTVGAFGILLAWMALHSGSLITTIAAHFTWNAGLLAASQGKLNALLPADDKPPGFILTAAAITTVLLAGWAFARTRGADEAETAGGDVSTS